MPEICRFNGMIISMYVNEGSHNIPHIHVEYQNNIYIISITDGSAIIGKQLNSRKLRKLNEWIEKNRASLMENWVLGKANRKLNKIEPLK